MNSCFKCDSFFVRFQGLFSILRTSKKYVSRCFRRLKFVFSGDTYSSSTESYELVSIEAREASESIASASNHAAESQKLKDWLNQKLNPDFDLSAMQEEWDAAYSAIEEMCGWSTIPDDDNDLNPPSRREFRRRAQSYSSEFRNKPRLREFYRCNFSERDLSFFLLPYITPKEPESSTSSLSSERTESMSLEETDSYASLEKQADMSHSLASSEFSYSSDSSEDGEISSSCSSDSAISKSQCDSSSLSEDSTLSNENSIDPIESYNGDFWNSVENCGSQDIPADSLEPSEASTDNDKLLASNEQQVTQYSETDDVDAIAEHDHLFNVKIFSEEEMSVETAYETVYRSAFAHLLVGFTYKWGNNADETSEVCLLHFCSVEGLVVFYTIRRDTYYVPPILQAILFDDSILKVGIFPGPLFEESYIVVNSTFDLRYALQICGVTPKKLSDLAKSVLGYNVNIYRGTRSTDKYFLETDSQYRTAYLEVYLAFQIFWNLREYYFTHSENDFDQLCDIYKDKAFRIRRPI